MKRFIVLASIGLSFLSVRASADAISGPPERCIEGSEPVDFCHGPPTCRALICESDADCGRGLACRERALCVREHCCNGEACHVPEVALNFTHVEASCAAGACDGTSCQTLNVCVPSRTGAGCCSATGTRSGVPGALFLSLILAAALRRSRR